MEIIYCDTCGARTSKPANSAEGEAIYCPQCEPVHKSAAPDVTPAPSVTKFYFCESCGKRITEDLRHDKKLKGVYCKNCARKVMTTEFEAIKEAPVAVETLPAAKASTSKAILAPAIRKAGSTHSVRHIQPAKAVRNDKPLLMMITAAVIATLGVVILLLPSGKPDAKPDTAFKVPAPVRANNGAATPASIPASASSTPQKTVVAEEEIPPKAVVSRKVETVPAEVEHAEIPVVKAPPEPAPEVASQPRPGGEIAAVTEAADDITPERKTVTAKSQPEPAVQATTSPPVITSSLIVANTVRTPYSYTITATNNPTSFEAGDLPAGLFMNTSTGVITGTPTVSGKFAIKLTAANAAGKATATLSLTLNAPLNVLYDGQTLAVGTKLISPNGRYTLTHQLDGDVVLCDTSNSAITWHSATVGKKTAGLVMQPDGNLVLYDAHTKALWHSGTNGRGSSKLVLEDTGKLVIYSLKNNAVEWSSKK